MLERILYVSRASAGTELSDVSAIAREAGLRNAREELSAGLVFVDGCFVQVLEGPAPALCAAYARILQDSRHMEISFRAREKALCRLFGESGLILCTGPTLSAGLLAEFGYDRGFPVETFPADVLIEFMVQTCRSRPDIASAATKALKA